MAFGLARQELNDWKKRAASGKIAFITHFWYDPRFPDMKTVTKVGCSDLIALEEWGKKYGLKKEWIHHRHGYPHFDLMGHRQTAILWAENKMDQVERLIKKTEKRNR
ncbi:hypothetical protein [Fictibacillus sp. KU28468]|uniref:hypothetical protein n=1 Tax=Fictibacillus sp. KU28468 TaxID=2991053 RepID=UPI00223DF3F2|nr:hypothetical protein [Fictibacillus sp. KU28468]UZJ77032.1 hypothetical protein OKX00_12520 [Fictibacillus sp. KU28468]